MRLLLLGFVFFLRHRFRCGRALQRRNLHRIFLSHNACVHRFFKERRGHIDDAFQRGQARVHRNQKTILLPRDGAGRVVAAPPCDGNLTIILRQGNAPTDLRFLGQFLAFRRPSQRFARLDERQQQRAVFFNGRALYE